MIESPRMVPEEPFNGGGSGVTPSRPGLVRLHGGLRAPATYARLFQVLMILTWPYWRMRSFIGRNIKWALRRAHLYKVRGAKLAKWQADNCAYNYTTSPTLPRRR